MFGQFLLASSEAIVLSLQNCKLSTVNKFHNIRNIRLVIKINILL